MRETNTKTVTRAPKCSKEDVSWCQENGGGISDKLSLLLK